VSLHCEERSDEAISFFIYLTPSVPLSYQGEGEEKGRGAPAPLGLPKVSVV